MRRYEGQVDDTDDERRDSGDDRKGQPEEHVPLLAPLHVSCAVLEGRRMMDSCCEPSWFITCAFDREDDAANGKVRVRRGVGDGKYRICMRHEGFDDFHVWA